MNNLSQSELLLYGGIGFVVFIVAMTVLGILLGIHKWKKLQKQLEQEYGKVQQ